MTEIIQIGGLLMIACGVFLFARTSREQRAAALRAAAHPKDRS